MKNGKLYKRIFNIVLVIAAYAYLFYTLLNFDNYAEVVADFRSAGWLQYGALLGAILLFPINILLESCKWKLLLQDIEPLTLQEAQAQTYYGFVGAFLTPSRLGDYPTRVTRLHASSQWLSAIALGFVGSLALTCVILLLSLPSCWLFCTRLLTQPSLQLTLLIVFVLVFVLMLLLVLFYPTLSARLCRWSRLGERTRQMLLTLSQFSYTRFFKACGWSVLRYLVFGAQLWGVLTFCGIDLDWQAALISIPTYYTLVTIMPSVPVADAAIKGSWSAIVFSAFTPNTVGVALAAIVLWVINTIFPMLVGTLVPSFSAQKEAK